MIHPMKFIWMTRAIVNKMFYGHIGKLTYMGKPCFIEGRRNIYIGNKTRIFPGVRMEAIGVGKIVIGNNVAIEQNVHITSMGGVLHIADDVTIAANTFITNLDHEYTDIDKSIMEQGHILKETSIGEGTFIGYGAAIQAGTILGRHCVVGTNSVVRGVFPDYSVIVGSPAKIVKRYDLDRKEWVRVKD